MYPHRIRTTRARIGASTDPATGAFTPAEDVVYEGPADVQDAGEAKPRSASGMPDLRSEATAFLEDEAAVSAHLPEDHAEVTWEDGTTSDATVAFARMLDGSLLLRFS